MPKFYSTFFKYFIPLFFCVSGHNQNTCYNLVVLFLLLYWFRCKWNEHFSAIVSIQYFIKLFQCNQLMLTPLLTPCFFFLLICTILLFFDNHFNSILSNVIKVFKSRNKKLKKKLLHDSLFPIKHNNEQYK